MKVESKKVNKMWNMQFFLTFKTSTIQRPPSCDITVSWSRKVHARIGQTHWPDVRWKKKKNSLHKKTIKSVICHISPSYTLGLTCHPERSVQLHQSNIILVGLGIEVVHNNSTHGISIQHLTLSQISSEHGPLPWIWISAQGEFLSSFKFNIIKWDARMERTYLSTQCAAVRIQYGVMTDPPHKCFPDICRLTCHGHTPFEVTVVPPTIRLSMFLPQSEANIANIDKDLNTSKMLVCFHTL